MYYCLRERVHPIFVLRGTKLLKGSWKTIRSFVKLFRLFSLILFSDMLNRPYLDEMVHLISICSFITKKNVQIISFSLLLSLSKRKNIDL